MDVNIDTTIYEDFDKSKLKRRLREDFKEKVDIKTPVHSRKRIKSRKKRKICR